MAGVGGQEEGLQGLLGTWKALGKRVRPELILETLIVSTDIRGGWQSGRVTSAGVTSAEFQTHSTIQLTGQTWASLRLGFPI